MLSLFSSRFGSARGVGRLVVMLAALAALFAVVLSPAASAQENEAPIPIAFARGGTAGVNANAVNPGDQVLLDGSLSFDPDGQPDGSDLTYRWTPSRGFAWLPLTGRGTEPTTTFFVPPAGYGDRITFTLTVTDTEGASASRTVSVTYNPPPTWQALDPVNPSDPSMDVPDTADTDMNPPQPDDSDETKLLVNMRRPNRGLRVRQVNGADEYRMGSTEETRTTDDLVYQVFEGVPMQLTVRATDAVGGPPLTYRWEQVSGTVRVPLTASGNSATLTTPDVPPPDPMNPAGVRNQTYEFAVRVTATDADGGTARQVFYIRVLELDLRPIADGGPNQDSALPRTDDDDDRILVQLSAAGTTDPDPYDIPVTIPAASSPTGAPMLQNIVYLWEVVRLETAAGVSDTDTPTDATEDLINQLDDMKFLFEWVADLNPNRPGLQGQNDAPGGELLETYSPEAGEKGYNFYSPLTGPVDEVPWNRPDIYLKMPAATTRCAGGSMGFCGSAPDGDPDEHPLLGGSVYVRVTAWSVIEKQPGVCPLAGDDSPAGADCVLKELADIVPSHRRVNSNQMDEIEIRIAEDPNEVPVVEAAVVGSGGRLVNDDVSVFEGEPVSLTAVQSEDDNENDPDFDGLTYTWEQTEPDPVNAAGTRLSITLANQNPNDDVCVNCVFGASHRLTTMDPVQEVVFSGDVTGLEIARPGRRARRDDFSFRLTVTDQYGVRGTADTSGDDMLTITVVEANEAPVVDAGDDQEVADGDEVTLSASATDPDLSVEDSTEAHTFVWEQTGGPEVELVDGGTATASFTAAGGAEGATLEFTVTVTDARGLSASDTVTVTVAATGEPEEPEPADFPMVLEPGEQVGAETLVASMSDRYAELVAEECDTAAGTASDSDTCATGELGPAPGAPADPDTFYSGPIDSATFCITFGAENNGLRLYAFDGDGDGVAETCVLPWSEREAAARQAALLRLGQEFLASQGG